MILTIILCIFLFIFFLVVSQRVIKCFTNGLYGKIEETREGFGDFTYPKQKDKSKKLGFITGIVGRGEFIFFAFFTALLFENYSCFNGLMVFLKVLAAWLGIKTLGNYGQWSNDKWGRSYFYVFLIGTILNIILAVLLGIAILKLSEIGISCLK